MTEPDHGVGFMKLYVAVCVRSTRRSFVGVEGTIQIVWLGGVEARRNDWRLTGVEQVCALSSARSSSVFALSMHAVLPRKGDNLPSHPQYTSNHRLVWKSQISHCLYLASLIIWPWIVLKGELKRGRVRKRGSSRDPTPGPLLPASHRKPAY